MDTFDAVLLEVTKLAFWKREAKDKGVFLLFFPTSALSISDEREFKSIMWTWDLDLDLKLLAQRLWASVSVDLVIYDSAKLKRLQYVGIGHDSILQSRSSCMVIILIKLPDGSNSS